MGRFAPIHTIMAAAMAVCAAWGAPSRALDALSFHVAGDDHALARDLRAASVLVAAKDEGRTDPRDLVATALAEYERLVTTLYDTGRFGSVVHVRIDGVEAASIPSYAVPDHVGQIDVSVIPGPQFRFGNVEIAPLAGDTTLPNALNAGQVASAFGLKDAVADTIDDWRAVGHAKAAVRSQDVVADHQSQTLSARVRIEPGPRVRFGHLQVITPSTVREARLRLIAGLPTGTVFSPEELDAAAARLRRTGAFSSVTLREADDLRDGETLDVELAVADMKPRRIGMGAEISTLHGAGLTGFWLHRNLFGGAERFRFEASATNITAGLAAIDVELAARLDIPAAFGTDTDAFVLTEAAMMREPTYRSWNGELTAGARRYFGSGLEGAAALGYGFSRVTDSQGTRNFSILNLPVGLMWDRRDSTLAATRGTYLDAGLEPFVDLAKGPGVWGKLDARVYRGIGAENRLVLAARFQLGTVIGPTPANTHPEYLFTSGGSATVRGQPYSSLSFPAGGTNQIGGQALVGAQLEARFQASDKIGVVGFFDAAMIGAAGLFDPTRLWHSGAGLGLRYDTELGPIRLDVALPVTGTTGTGVQIYLGIGHTF